MLNFLIVLKVWVLKNQANCVQKNLVLKNFYEMVSKILVLKNSKNCVKKLQKTVLKIHKFSFFPTFSFVANFHFCVKNYMFSKIFIFFKICTFCNPLSDNYSNSVNIAISCKNEHELFSAKIWDPSNYGIWSSKYENIHSAVVLCSWWVPPVVPCRNHLVVGPSQFWRFFRYFGLNNPFYGKIY